MRKSALVLLAASALLAGCGGQSEEAMQADESMGPNVSPTAAPGVAFRYAYDYQLPDEAISAVQEAHAAKCESLGVQRCRITGLEYRVIEDSAISATLQVKLAPQIARQFGKTATLDVARADGKLLRTEFSGEDVMPVTTEAGRQQATASERIADLERQLASATTGEERAQIQQQLSQLRDQISQNRTAIAGAAERLASTPMTFNYYGRGGIAGFTGNPVREAVRSFVSSFVTMVTFLLRAIALLLPWALLLALFVLIARSRPGRAVRRFFAQRPVTDEEA
jgi:uncharacterized lipoprotein